MHSNAENRNWVSLEFFIFTLKKKGVVQKDSSTRKQPLMDKITQINVVLKEYFTLNKTVRSVPAKDMMPYFILAGIFPSDHNNGRPIRDLLRKLDADKKLRRIPFAVAERKTKNTSWFFRRGVRS